MRIVSLLPSTTEILFAIGAGDDVVGVTFECDYPEEARTRRIVSTSAMPEGLTPAEIDAFVVEAMRRGDDLYHLDEGALAGLDADLVVTQDLCAVCAVDVSVVDDALAHLGCTAEVLTIDPHTLDEVFGSIETLGKATGHDEEAAELVGYQRRRLAAVWARSAWRKHRPRVMFLEWTDPPFAPGHWIPEMIELAGGIPVLGTGGEKSRRVSWDDVHAARAGRRRGRAVRLRPRGQPGPRRPAGGERRAAGRRTRARRRRQRLLGPARHPPGRRHRGAVGAAASVTTGFRDGRARPPQREAGSSGTMAR